MFEKKDWGIEQWAQNILKNGKWKREKIRETSDRQKMELNEHGSKHRGHEEEEEEKKRKPYNKRRFAPRGYFFCFCYYGFFLTNPLSRISKIFWFDDNKQLRSLIIDITIIGIYR